MKQEHSYRATDVEQIDLGAIVERAAVGCMVAIDVANVAIAAQMQRFIFRQKYAPIHRLTWPAWLGPSLRPGRP
jgi:hypothetical protein